MEKRYDYIIAGAGCAGLSLAYHLNESSLRNKSLLIIDRERKNSNDRTWCFWEKGENPFEAIVHRQWSTVHFYGKTFRAPLQLAPYRYKMIRGIDFYQFVQQKLHANPRITQLSAAIRAVEENGSGARVVTDEGVYEADWVFDSTHLPRLNLPQYHNLLQHFKGWVIETEAATFDPGEATLMDFRIEQRGEARFFYVLPLDAHRALVEFTLFSAQLLPAEEYAAELQAYLRDYLKLDQYRIQHEEFGIIPMTDEVLVERPSAHVVRIGTSGGYTKPSTGYTFMRIQERTTALVQAMLTTGRPIVPKKAFRQRFGIYDSVLLNVMQHNRCEAREVFTDLFRKNPPARVFRFLDEHTTFPQELQIMASVPSIPFMAAVLDVFRKKVRF